MAERLPRTVLNVLTIVLGFMLAVTYAVTLKFERIPNNCSNLKLGPDIMARPPSRKSTSTFMRAIARIQSCCGE